MKKVLTISRTVIIIVSMKIKVYPPNLNTERGEYNLRKLINDADVKIQASGSWLYVGGCTLPHRDKLKSVGGQWLPKRRLWLIRDAANIPVFDDEEIEQEESRREFERDNRRWERERRSEFTALILDNGGIKMGKSLRGEYNENIPLHLKRKDGLYLDEFIGVVNDAGQFGRIDTDDDLIKIMKRLW